MVEVDIYVPVLDRNYDFLLNEETKVGILLEDIVEDICQKEQCSVRTDAGKLMLWSKATGEILSEEKTLAQYGIRNGFLLMLV